ncbi:RNA polymerase sigma-70 factor, sigma-E family [Nakamurella panacisegetis]|uniref:RNA polymerase sigma-70 factor, sigma-E family n=1 Tax=Nakamurella panacisegetis TaxID=1090615 RepID=A0A1H0RCC5_9ACTN|nr:SigE family RNA polymerase sigma factor [Nakamurella panacisegetis]SDP27065.1 RNA polymerase sigma-70 factor, sigma-E family [Nakamurella panacisegetis]
MGRAGTFDDFFQLQQAGLVRYAALLAGSTAQGEDLVQDVLVKIYLRWDQLSDGEGNLLAYARRAVTNEHLSWRRRWSTRHIDAVGDRLPDTPVDPWLDGPDEELWQRLQALPARPRAALIMRFYQDLTDSEIAESLNCRTGTVRAHISRGLAALRIDGEPPQRPRPSSRSVAPAVAADPKGPRDER